VAGSCLAGPSTARGAGGGRAGRPACCARGGGGRTWRAPAAGGPAAPAAGGRRAHLHVRAGRRAVPAGARRAPPRGVRGCAWVSVTLAPHRGMHAQRVRLLGSIGEKRCAPGVLSGPGRSGCAAAGRRLRGALELLAGGGDCARVARRQVLAALGLSNAVALTRQMHVRAASGPRCSACVPTDSTHRLHQCHTSHAFARCSRLFTVSPTP